MQNDLTRLRQLDRASAQRLLAAVDAFFSGDLYLTKGACLSHNEGAGLIPTPTSMGLALKRWGNPSYGISESSIALPEGITWRQLQQCELVDRLNGLLRVDLVRSIVQGSSTAV